MSDSRGSSDREWSFSELQKVDALCEQFEKRWREGSRPSIEALLAENPDVPRPQLLYELLCFELDFRRRAGESPTREEYDRRFPNDQATVARVWRWIAAAEPENTVSLTAANPTEPLSPSVQPVQLGRFLIRRTLGKGAFGVVYHAYDPQRDGDVALKVSHAKIFKSAEKRTEFVEEARTGQRLDHPHLVKTLGIEEDNERVYIIQQLIQGENLADWHRQAQPDQEKIVEVLIPVAEALGYLHEKGYVHRDLKPANILIDENDRAAVADFGLALHEDEQRGRKGELAGTWAYMSPEQIRGLTHLIDGQSDIWSLGVIFYRLLTDRLPFGGPPPRWNSDDRSEYLRELEYEIQEHDPKPPRQIRPDISRKLEEICLRCLEKRKRQRYHTGHDLAEDLRLFLKKAAPEAAMDAPSPLPTVVPKGLRSFDASDASFFLELLPGVRTSEGIPASLSFWRNRLLGSGVDAPLDIGVLYGPSGCGKSSFVRAGLLPMLGDKFVSVVIEATASDTEVRLLKALRQAVPALPLDLSVVEACRWVAEHRAERGRKLLVVIDQFEQWLHARSESSDQLVRGLRQCNGTRLQSLLLVRDDFWMPLTRFMEQLEIPLREGINAAAVDLFDRDHAMKVLVAFGKAFGRLPAEGKISNGQQRFLEQAIDGLAEDNRVVCVRLALFAEMMKDRPWTPEELAAVGGAKGVGVVFLNEKLGPKAPAAYQPYREAAQKVLQCLLPSYGTNLKGQMRTVDELRQAAGFASRQPFDQLLRILDSDLKLLTPVVPDVSLDHADSVAITARGGSLCYQLTHDYLVPSLREWLTAELRRTRAGRALIRLRELAEDWSRRPSPRPLPSLMQWLSIWLLVPRRTWTIPQKKMMSAANRYFVSRTAMLAVILLVLAIVGWQINGQIRGQALHDKLLSAASAEVPRFVPEVARWRRWVIPLLDRTYKQESANAEKIHSMTGDQLRRRLHPALVLGEDDVTIQRDVVAMIPQVPPDDLSIVIEMLRPLRPEVRDELGQSLKQAADNHSSAVLPLATVLAATGPADHHLHDAADEIAQRLRDSLPTEFPQWLHSLQPIATILQGPLLAHWRAVPPPQGPQRTQLLESLALLGAADAATLSAAIADAEPAELMRLVLPLKRLGTAGEKELMHPTSNSSGTPPSLRHSASLPPLDDNMRRAVEAVQGRLGEHAGFALAAKQSELQAINQQLSRFGFRPLSVRPYRRSDQPLATVTWRRDGREARTETSQTSDQFRAAIDKHAVENFFLVDMAFDGDGATEDSIRWCGVWERKDKVDPETKIEFERPIGERFESESDLKKQGFRLVRYVVRVDSKGQQTYTAIWKQLSPSQHEIEKSTEHIEPPDSSVRTRYAAMYGDLYPGSIQVDLRAHRLAAGKWDTVAAYEDYLEVRRQNPQHRELPSYLNRSRRTDEAIPLLDRALSANPNDVEFRITLAKCLAASGQLERLRAEIELLDKNVSQPTAPNVPSPKPSTELEMLRLRAAVLAKDRDAARAAYETLDMRLGKSPTIHRVTINALLADVLELMDPKLAAEYRNRAIGALAELSNTRSFTAYEQLNERAEWDGLRATPGFQALLRTRKLDYRYTAVWRSQPHDVRSQQHLGQSLTQFIDFASQSLPTGVVPIVIEPETGDKGEVTFASLWHSQLVPREVAVRIAKQAANRALAAAHLGNEKPLRDLLDEVRGERDARSFAIERLARSGLPLAQVEAMLAAENSPPLKWALLLALGEYPSGEVGSATKKMILGWAATEPDAAVRSAAQWSTRRWDPSVAFPDSAASQADAAQCKWYDFQGHTMIQIDPQDFRMGSPGFEPDRDDSSEKQAWTRIPRRFSLSQAPTTAKQFRQFLSAVKDRLPPNVHAYMRSRNSLTEQLWRLDCPQGGVRRVEAMMYCEWLSEQKGIPESERCYPDIWKFVSNPRLTAEEQKFGYRPTVDVLSRPGIRLPTEAELEFGIRGGNSQSRHFGDSDELLDAYCWYRGNSNGKTWPVGLKKPNEFGLFDVMGNVSQQCQDLYVTLRLPSNSAVREDSLPEIRPEIAGAYVIRGADCESAPRELRSANRVASSPNNVRFTIGFRIAQTEPNEPKPTSER